MAYTSCITIELLSMFRWKETGWKAPVSLVSPDVTIRLAAHESCANNNWKLDLSVASVDNHNEWADPSLQDKIVAAVMKRCQHDVKVVRIFGASLRNTYINGMKRSNMFYPTDFRVNFNYKYRFIVALEGETYEKLDGIYLVPSYIPAPRDGFDAEQFYKLCCYERFE